MLGCTYTCECVGVREWVWLNVCGSTCESVCLATNIHVNVGVREWSWLSVLESTCESVCELFECVRIYMRICVCGCKYTCECGCS